MTSTTRASTPDLAGDTGLACLLLLARYHLIAVEAEQLRHDFAVAGQPINDAQLLRAARHLGLRARWLRDQRKRLSTTPLPAIARDKDGHYFILARADSEQVLIHDPRQAGPASITREALAQRWSGAVLLLTSPVADRQDIARFDFSWFIPALVRYRRLLAEVVIASVVLQLTALATPLLFQVVMDKVLVHRSLATLDVVAVGLFGVVTFEVAFGALRTYLLAHTSSRMDVELGARLFRQLLNLPLPYFRARRVGDSVARVKELENIRAFLTGSGVTALLDFVFSIVLLAVMLLYSWQLTLIVLISLPCYFLLSLGLTPVLRSRLEQQFNRGAENQAFLVESINGIETLKANAVEPQWTRRWDQQLARYVHASLRTTTQGLLASSGIGYIGKLVTVGTLWWGARLVIDGRLTVGQLIAFNMLATQVAAPVLRLAQVWTDFQQVGVSMRRLGDILNTRGESQHARPALAPLRGSIVFDDVQFRYPSTRRQAVRGISLSVQPGETIGIVGSSGSGKSTLAKLVQRLYVPDEGRILIDDVDIATVDVSSLRRQLGVVPQENILFNRSIRDNIALADPSLPLQRVMAAAKMAGSHDFITQLPEGYDTLVGEHGATLSGGQRQRIAIARALLKNPRILIFDEATSALDYESEHIIQRNMHAIRQGRTVLIIAHRLSAVKHADRIVVMDAGQIVETGTHTELLARADGRYAALHRMQLG